jgi:hypothetical protein
MRSISGHLCGSMFLEPSGQIDSGSVLDGYVDPRAAVMHAEFLKRDRVALPMRGSQPVYDSNISENTVWQTDSHMAYSCMEKALFDLLRPFFLKPHQKVLSKKPKTHQREAVSQIVSVRTNKRWPTPPAATGYSVSTSFLQCTRDGLKLYALVGKTSHEAGSELMRSHEQPLRAVV